MLPSLPVDAVRARLSALPSTWHRAVATDADGTLWAIDVGDELFLTLAARHDFRGEARDTLRARARGLLEAVPDDDFELARALMRRYAAGEIAIDVMCELQAEAVGERTESELAALYDDVATRVAAAVRDEVRALLTALVAEAWTVHVVSGSLGDAVAACLTRADIPFHSVAGARLQRDGARVRGRLDGEIPLFDGKVRALAATGRWPAALGLGDGGWDVTFLRDAGVPVLVHPKPALAEALRDHPRAVVLV